VCLVHHDERAAQANIGQLFQAEILNQFPARSCF
jgi:hypothetical protein